jgi:Outer membrane protein beta-barrel domain
MVNRPVGILVGVVLGLSVASNASAQTPPTTVGWSHGTTVNLFAGVATASSDTGPLAGGAFGWEVTPRIGIEGSGSWLDRADGAGAFAADLKALINLAPGHAVMPFLHGGIGMYRAWFDLSQGTLPDFYADRLEDSAVAVTTPTFTDPSFVVGGGMNFFVSRHLAIRPDVDWKIVRSHSESYVVTTVNVHLSYHFEDHPITPSRRVSGR